MARAGRRRGSAEARRRRAGARSRPGAPLRVEVSGGVATISLSRPDAGNRLDRRALAELASALETCDLSADARVVAVRGAGRDFCLGADVGEPPDCGSEAAPEREGPQADLGDVLLALRALPKVTVAIVSGRALGEGCGLAAACDLVLARAGSSFGLREETGGAVPAAVVPLLRGIVGEKVVFDLAATGRVLDAAAAQRAGLVSRVLPSRGFESAVTKMLAGLARAPATPLALAKRQLYGGDEGGAVEAGVRRGARVDAAVRTTRAAREGSAS